ncbi:MAG: winged helix-turn-helix domain-containing protein, partial [Usitatibacter sp.]
MPVGTESPPAPGKERLRVGDWAVEPALNQLSAAGKTVKLEPKAMSVLVYLADRPGQVVSREALLAAVWPGVLVGDDSLTQVVIKLRKALGDVPENPAYIQTISKGGYRLVAPVLRSEEIASTTVRPDSKSLHADRVRRVRWIPGAGIAALLLAAAAAWWINGERVTVVPPGPVPMASVEAARTAQPTVAI